MKFFKGIIKYDDFNLPWSKVISLKDIYENTDLRDCDTEYARGVNDTLKALTDLEVIRVMENYD